MNYSFEKIWLLIENHGGVAESYKEECERLWAELTEGQQERIYCIIRDKKFFPDFSEPFPKHSRANSEPIPRLTHCWPFSFHYLIKGVGRWRWFRGPRRNLLRWGKHGETNWLLVSNREGGRGAQADRDGIGRPSIKRSGIDHCDLIAERAR